MKHQKTNFSEFFAKLEDDESFAAKIVLVDGHKFRTSGATV
jgi:hypothetical protein